MNVGLWIAQVLLALVSGMIGFMKLIKPKEEAYKMGMKYVEDFSESQLKLIGAAELAGAIGLILPWALNILPTLTPLAAVGLTIVQLGAAYTHFRRGEMPMIGVNAVLIALAAFVAWGRFAGAI